MGATLSSMEHGAQPMPPCGCAGGQGVLQGFGPAWESAAVRPGASCTCPCLSVVPRVELTCSLGLRSFSTALDSDITEECPRLLSWVTEGVSLPAVLRSLALGYSEELGPCTRTPHCPGHWAAQSASRRGSPCDHS